MDAFSRIMFSALPIMDYETINIKIKMVGGYFIPIQLLVFHSYNQAEMKEFELTNTSV